jgi:uncharacterized membrane protein (UPF0127 family)
MKILFLAAAVILAMAVFFSVLPSYSGDSQIRGKNQSRVCFRQDCFEVELAITPQEQERGLMGMEGLGHGKGMLFVFPQEGVYPFWMKGMLIPLDMVWMDSNGTVVHIEENVQPCKADPCPIINPGVQAKYVLEVDAGTADRIGLAGGDKMSVYI